jgi:hypothetical protein
MTGFETVVIWQLSLILSFIIVNTWNGWGRK